MDNKIEITKNQLEDIKEDIKYIATYNQALDIEFNKEEQYATYIDEKINSIEKHLENIKKICKL